MTDPVYSTDHDDERVILLGKFIERLPRDALKQVEHELAHATVEYERTGATEPLMRLARSLLLTARLHRNAEFHRAMDEADKELAHGLHGPALGGQELRDHLDRMIREAE